MHALDLLSWVVRKLLRKQLLDCPRLSLLVQLNVEIEYNMIRLFGVVGVGEQEL
jgi:hypothetical protein